MLKLSQRDGGRTEKGWEGLRGEKVSVWADNRMREGSIKMAFYLIVDHTTCAQKNEPIKS